MLFLRVNLGVPVGHQDVSYRVIPGYPIQSPSGVPHGHRECPTFLSQGEPTFHSRHFSAYS